MQRMFIYCILVLVCALLFSSPAHALELNYPDIPGFGDLDKIAGAQTLGFAQIIQLFYAAALWLAALGAFGATLYAGFVFATSADNPSRRREGQERLTGLALGLLILASSFLVLRTINPDLTLIKNSDFAICKPAGFIDCFKLPWEGGGSSPATAIADINQCEFIRGDRTPSAAKYQSPLLLGYFREASQLSGMPAYVLAAFMRVESPSLTSFSDEQIQNYQCAESPTGALGVMQLQPAGTTGHCAQCVANGARLLGVAYEDLTREHYCDVRQSIIMGSGWILKKMQFLGYGDGTSWDSAWTNDPEAIYAMVRGYYGCLLYPSCTNGPYNYGKDVWESIQACVALTGGKDTPSGCPVKGCKLGPGGDWQNHINTRCGPASGDPKYLHCGLDVVSSDGDGAEVYATMSGTLALIGSKGQRDSFGACSLGIRSENGIFQINYVHLKEDAPGANCTFPVAPGTQVTRGQLIGYQDTTGIANYSHTHYSIWQEGSGVDPTSFGLTPVR